MQKYSQTAKYSANTIDTIDMSHFFIAIERFCLLKQKYQKCIERAPKTRVLVRIAISNYITRDKLVPSWSPVAYVGKNIIAKYAKGGNY